MERTFIAVKPDGVQRGLCGEIIKRFETRGFKLVAAKFVQASEDHMKKHYLDLKDMPFYAGLCKYMSSGPVFAMVWEGQSIVKLARMMLGETNPADSKPGSIRGDLCINIGRNIIHGRGVRQLDPLLSGLPVRVNPAPSGAPPTHPLNPAHSTVDPLPWFLPVPPNMQH
uniref:Nucleoside diphosphate kinase B n=1 Tax=Xiphophorus maculatus TaxID=8083 RepID=A0A3B5QGU4_XIPMA